MILQGDGSAAIPHLSVPNISYVDWKALKGAGFQGCVFDKDNTLTEPYAIAIAPILVNSLKRCIETFGGDNVVLLSNSAGLEEFDPEGLLSQFMVFLHPICCYVFYSIFYVHIIQIPLGFICGQVSSKVVDFLTFCPSINLEFAR